MELDQSKAKDRRVGVAVGRDTLDPNGVESRSYSFFDAAPSAVFVCDRAGFIQDFNVRAAELWGREPQRGDSHQGYCGSLASYQLNGQALPHAESLAMWVIRTGERISNVKAVIERPDKSRITVRMNLAPLRDSANEISGAIISFDDISEFERVQEELRESENRYRHLVETSPYGIGVHRNGHLLYCNAHAVQILRARSLEELVGRSMFDFVHCEDRAKVADRIQSIVADGKTVAPMVIRLIAVDRTEVAVEAIGRSVLFQGKPAIQTVLREVTETQQALAALAASEERFRTLAEQATDGIFLTDAQGRYTDVNSAGCEMLGYTRQEICRLGITDIIAPAEIQRVESALKSLHDGHPVRSEWHFRRKDGSIFPGEVSAKTLPDSRVLACLRDITERKLAEESLRVRQAKWLHAARLSTVGEMVAALSHEVSQPLSSIGNFAAACAKMLDSNRKIHRVRLRDHIQQISKQIQRCGAILQRLRDFSRRDTCHRADCDLNQLLRESCALMSNDLRGHDVTVEFDLAPTLPPISCDRIQIEQVVVNLLINARDAMRDQLDDRRCMFIRSRLDGDWIAFEVADRGIGLSDEVSKSLFEPFFTTKVNGMGIGLSIAKTIIADHGGQIECHGNEDGGATFCVRLPIPPGV